jgi:hypothetical protein
MIHDASMVQSLVCQQNDIGSEGDLLRGTVAVDELSQLFSFRWSQFERGRSKVRHGAVLWLVVAPSSYRYTFA